MTNRESIELASLLRRRRRIDRRISQLLGQEPATDDLPWQLSDDQLGALRSLTWTPPLEAQLEPAEITVVGVDGAPGGWAAVGSSIGRLSPSASSARSERLSMSTASGPRSWPSTCRSG